MKTTKTKRIHAVAEIGKEKPRLTQRAQPLSGGVHLLEIARLAAPSIGRVLSRILVFQGTGVMISDRLFLTNNHVIYDPEDAMTSLVEFNYELNRIRQPKPVTRFVLAPDNFFMSSPQEDLDFTVVAVGDRILGKRALSDFGYCPIKNADDEPLGESVNVIHHPSGNFKQIDLHGELAAHTDEVLHYRAKTRSGSSGAPVFNDHFELIGIHHYRCPSRAAKTIDGSPEPKDVHEGIRMSAIVKRINSEKIHLGKKQRALIDTVLDCPFKCPSLLKR